MTKGIKYVVYIAAAFVIFLLVRKYLKKKEKPKDENAEKESGGGGGGGGGSNGLPNIITANPPVRGFTGSKKIPIKDPFGVSARRPIK